MPETVTALPDEQATVCLAHAWSPILRTAVAARNAPVTVFLRGDLGSGKTTFARALLAAFGYRGKVKSPTYTLLETYRLPEFRVLHFDLYRFADPWEWQDAGFDDEISGCVLMLIEWPERAENLLPPADASFEFTVRERGRTCKIDSVLPTAQDFFR